MAEMGDDMNATPLTKLPPPVLQSKTSQMPVEAPNYRDLLTDVDQNARHRGSMQSPTPMMEPLPSMPPPPPPQQHQQHPPQQQMMMYSPQQDLQAAPMGGFPTHPTWPSQAYPPPRPPTRRPLAAPPPKTSVAWRLLLDNKTPLIVVVIMFLALVFAVPRMVRVGRLATAEGRLNVLGAVALSVTGGGLFKLATAVS